MKSTMLALAAFVFTFVGVAYAIEKVDLKDIKCMMNLKSPAKEDKSSDWKEGKVYFCCGNCLASFEKDKKAKAAQANHQLIATKQVEQQACPFSGGKLNAEQKVEFKGATISFCCGNCKAKAEKMTDDDKVAKLFGEEAYDKSKFKKVAAK